MSQKICVVGSNNNGTSLARALVSVLLANGIGVVEADSPEVLKIKTRGESPKLEQPLWGFVEPKPARPWYHRDRQGRPLRW